MRFLDTRTGTFVEQDPNKMKFAILSHTWDAAGEQSHKELRRVQKRYSTEVRCPRHNTNDPRLPSLSSPEGPLTSSHLPLSIGMPYDPLEAAPSRDSLDGSATSSHHLSATEDDPLDYRVTMKGAQGSRWSRLIDTVRRFIRSILCSTCLATLLPPDRSALSTRVDDAQPISHAVGKPSRDPIPLPATKERPKRPSCSKTSATRCRSISNTSPRSPSSGRTQKSRR